VADHGKRESTEECCRAHPHSLHSLVTVNMAEPWWARQAIPARCTQHNMARVDQASEIGDAIIDNLYTQTNTFHSRFRVGHQLSRLQRFILYDRCSLYTENKLSHWRPCIIAT